MIDEIDVKLPPYLDNLPFWFDWVMYKGEHCVAQVNLEKSLACHRPIIDIHYCMTKAFNGIVEKTVNYVPEHFKPSKLSQ